MQHKATRQTVYIEIQLGGFCVMEALTKGYFRKDLKTVVVLWMILNNNLEMVYVF